MSPKLILYLFLFSPWFVTSYFSQIDSCKDDLNFVFYFLDEEKKFDHENSISLIQKVLSSIPSKKKKIILAFNGHKLIGFNKDDNFNESSNYFLDTISSYCSFKVIKNNNFHFISETSLMYSVKKNYDKYLPEHTQINKSNEICHCNFHYIIDSPDISEMLSENSKLNSIINHFALISLFEIQRVNNHIYVPKDRFNELSQDQKKIIKKNIYDVKVM
tara:strand:- start:289 stop:939 length:651 start_codon:yes stop_codon:yes gene_type:complete